jgi:two-component system sensor histidine kinase SenX3
MKREGAHGPDRTINSVDRSTWAFGVVVALALLLVALVAWRLSEREQAGSPAAPAPLVPAGVESVLTVLRSSGVLIGSDDKVLKASAPAYSLGIVHGDRLWPESINLLVQAVRRDGQVREEEVVLTDQRGRNPRHVLARVAPLSSHLVLVLAEDRTRERRVEHIRRDFVANVSHELKTPVGALNLLAEAVGQAADDPEAVRRFSGRMLVESERLTRLVQQIIELSRLQDDQLIDEPVEVSLTEVVDRALDRSRIDAAARNISLVARHEADLEVLGNPEQLFTAVSNLVENAVAYSPEGSRVSVIVERARPESHDDLEGPHAAVMVSDQGIGIARDDLDRIFERFYRVDPARARNTGGTGLGLSVVKHVAASHGGDVRVWSEPGHGSSFTLRLPLRPAAVPAVSPPELSVDRTVAPTTQEAPS